MLLSVHAAVSVAMAAPDPVPAPAAVTVAIEAEAFQFTGDWEAAGGPGTPSGNRVLYGGTGGATHPAVTAVRLPRAGRYRLWVRSLDFPDQDPGTRVFRAVVAGKAAARLQGASGKAGWTWEPAGEFDLSAGLNLLSLREGRPFSRVDALVLTTDLALVLDGPLGKNGTPAATPPAPLPVPGGMPDPLAAPGPVTDVPGAAPAARIASARTRVEWIPARGADGRPTVRPRISSKTGKTWRVLAVDPAAETYCVVAGTDPRYVQGAFYPSWDDARNRVPSMTVTAGGATETTLRPFPRKAIWAAGAAQRLVPRSAAPVPGRPGVVRLTFYPSPDGDLVADWELRVGEYAPRVTLTFTPRAAGSYTLGYQTPWRRPLAAVPELLMPPTFERRRFPAEPVTALDCLTPTPVSLAQTRGESPEVWGVIGDPAEIPFAWPDFRKPHFGLMIRDGGGQVHPALFGPVPGMEPAKRKAGQAQAFRFRLLAQSGDWYAGYRTAADEVFGWRDYRQNDRRGSLTDAALNMIDLVRDDDAGGWWAAAKASYQIESRNGSTHSAPLVPLSLYYLTGDEDLFRRRVLPTLEFMTSRNGPHFSPNHDVGGRYAVGGMDGPSKSYGTPIYGGLWQMTGRRTPAFAEFAFPSADAVRRTGSYGHAQPFDDWLSRYEITGDAESLRRARTLADAYLEKQIKTAPTGDIGWEPFFLISYTPNWEGLLRLYEVTREQRYLDGAAFGARQLMTGVWTQPLFPAGEVPVNGDGMFAGERSIWWKGPTPYRLGSPRKPGDTPVRSAPAWQVSNVGLSFEQPSTYRAGGGAGQMIYQAVWAPAFLRLARYTKDPQFETYARNAVVGRWTNYPGYYATGLTDIPISPRFPYDGPDVTSIYYHHILPHLGWTIDYLVSEAELRSAGAVSFPSLRQIGYAYFDGRVFGHAPGRIGPINDARLWLRRDLVRCDNPQINFLTAHADGGRRFVVLLMNESARPETVRTTFAAGPLGIGAATTAAILDLATGKAGSAVSLVGPAASVTVPARGFVVLALDGCRVAVPAAQRTPAPAPTAGVPKPGPAPSYVVVRGQSGTSSGMEGRAAALQIRPGPWQAYIWSTALPEEAKRISLRCRIGSGDWQTTVAPSYPFEFSVPVADPAAVVRFELSGERADGRTFTLPEASVAAPAP
jgi:hypothetical protein